MCRSRALLAANPKVAPMMPKTRHRVLALPYFFSPIKFNVKSKNAVPITLNMIDR